MSLCKSMHKLQRAFEIGLVDVIQTPAKRFGQGYFDVDEGGSDIVVSGRLPGLRGFGLKNLET